MDNEMRESLIEQAKDGELFPPSVMIPIRDSAGTCIGHLYSLGKAAAENSWIAATLAAWRQIYMCYFLTQFTATPERTAAWMRGVCVADPERIMFLIGDTARNLLGHVGARNIRDGKAELDNMIRGVKGGHVDLMHYAVLALIGWLRDVLDVTFIYTGIFADNAMAIQLHERIGLRVARTVAAQKTIVLTPDGKGEEIAYIVDEFRPPAQGERGYVIMEMGVAKP